MASKLKLRPTPWALAMVAFDVWKRLSPKQRQQALSVARKHGPKVAKRIVKSRVGKK